MKKTYDPVLKARRDAVEAYANKMCTVLWRTDKDLVYTIASDTEPRHSRESSRFHLCAGQLYSGIAYSYNAGSYATWMDLAGEPDEDGVYTITGLNWKALSGSSGTARIGIDCSSTVIRSWQSIGARIPAHATGAMTEENGFLPVGEYKAPKDEYVNTIEDCAANGEQTMYKAYALLQKGDAIVMSKPTNGHTRQVCRIEVVRTTAGNINGEASYVFCNEQCANYTLRLQSEEFVGDLSPFCRTDKAYTFKTLFETGYLPITIKELVDPAPIAEFRVADTVAQPTAENLFEGTITSNRGLDAVIITVTDDQGKEAQRWLARPWRSRTTDFAFQMKQFLDDGPEKTLGSLDLNALPAGNYTITVTARTVSGSLLTVRKIPFAR